MDEVSEEPGASARPRREAVDAIPHVTVRLTVPIDAPFDEFRARYESAVPAFPAAEFDALAARGADWQTVLERTAAAAPHGFLIYWKLDLEPLMRLAGHALRCVEYLMGNHAIAERMFRHDPAVMLYAPLRAALHQGADRLARFSIDQPSTRFASFEQPEIARVGLELDGRVAALLEHLGAPVPAALRAGGPESGAGGSHPAGRASRPQPWSASLD